MKSEFGVKDGASSDGLRDNLPFGAGRVSIPTLQSLSGLSYIFKRICPGIEMAERTLVSATFILHY